MDLGRTPRMSEVRKNHVQEMWLGVFSALRTGEPPLERIEIRLLTDGVISRGPEYYYHARRVSRVFRF